MSASAAPYGLIPINSSIANLAPTCLKNGIASGLAANIFRNQPVMLDTTNGTITPITANSDRIYGVFIGVEYTPTGQRPVESNFWASGQTYVAGLDVMNVYIWPAWLSPIRWKVQANGSVPQGAYGDQFNFATFGNGSTVTGLSTDAVSATPVGNGVQGQVQLIEFGENIGNAPGDAFTDLIVAISYPQAVVTGQVSRG